MLHLLFLICVAIGSIYALWLFFLAVMTLQRARNANLLTKTSTILGVPILLVGYALDCFCNVVVLTVILFEFPEEITVTERLKRHNKAKEGWRLHVASWFIPLLDPFDPSGKHITD